MLHMPLLLHLLRPVGWPRHVLFMAVAVVAESKQKYTRPGLRASTPLLHLIRLVRAGHTAKLKRRSEKYTHPHERALQSSW